MKIYEVLYSTDWKDLAVEHTHDHTILTFVVKADSKQEALGKVIEQRPELNKEKFEVEEILGDVYLADDESYDE